MAHLPRLWTIRSELSADPRLADTPKPSSGKRGPGSSPPASIYGSRSAGKVCGSRMALRGGAACGHSHFGSRVHLRGLRFGTPPQSRCRRICTIAPGSVAGPDGRLNGFNSLYTRAQSVIDRCRCRLPKDPPGEIGSAGTYSAPRTACPSNRTMHSSAARCPGCATDYHQGRKEQILNAVGDIGVPGQSCAGGTTARPGRPPRRSPLEAQ